MTPDEMAQIHGDAFLEARGWSALEFRDLLAQPYTAALTTQGGFAIIRTLAGESELLTLAVAPPHQRCGIAHRLITDWLTMISPEADTAFLEVAADNTAACALYEKNGFTRSGLRKAYYARTKGPPVDAMMMTRALTQG